MSINAYLEFDIRMRPETPDDIFQRALDWARKENLDVQTRVFHGEYTCSYLDASIAGFTDMMAESGIPPRYWNADVEWSTEENANKYGGHYRICFRAGRIISMAKSHLEMSLIEPWPEIVEYANDSLDTVSPAAINEDAQFDELVRKLCDLMGGCLRERLLTVYSIYLADKNDAALGEVVPLVQTIISRYENAEHTINELKKLV